MALETFVFLSTVATTASTLVVTTKDGDVHGRQDGTCNVFFGIPYAAPPTGELRWRPPSRAERWNTPLDCTTDTKPECVQPIDYTFSSPGWLQRILEVNQAHHCTLS